MTVLTAMRWTLLGGVVLYGSALVIGSVQSEVGLLVGLAAIFAMACSALGCVILQVRQLLGWNRHKPVEKPE